MNSVSVDSNKLKSLFGAYYDRRMFRILLLGIISGFPWVLIASALSLWLKEEGLSRSTIGWAGLIFGVYAFNFLWAPIIDRLRLPFLTNKLGHRKSIIIFMQTVILIGLIIWSSLEPTQNLALIIGVGLAIAISSATQDITIDALRIEQINKEETSSMAAGAASTCWPPLPWHCWGWPCGAGCPVSGRPRNWAMARCWAPWCSCGAASPRCAVRPWPRACCRWPSVPSGPRWP